MNRTLWVSRLPYCFLGMILFWFLFSPIETKNFRDELHASFVSSHGMTIAEHLSPDDHWVMHNRKVLTDDQRVIYEPYNRFPITSFAMIRGAAEIGGDQISARIGAARFLMRLFWVSAATLFFLTLVRLSNNTFASAGAVLFGFASHYYLFYGEMIFNDIPMVFGWALLLHGMVVWEQENKRRQFLFKAAVAVSIGWQSFTLLLPYLLFRSIRRLRTDGWKTLPKEDSIWIAVGAVTFGGALLGIKFWNEARATGLPLTQLPSVQSMLFRFGAGAPEAHLNDANYTAWAFFIPEQLWRIGTALSPISLISLRNLWLDDGTLYRWFADSPMTAHLILRIARIIVGCGGIIIALCAVRRFPHRSITGALLLSGFLWSFPMRHFTAVHPFQTFFYIGIPLTAYTFLFSTIQHHRPRWKLPLLLLSGVVLITSTYFMRSNYTRNNNSAFWNGVTEEFQTIASALPRECRLFVNGDLRTIGGGWHAVPAYLPNCIFTENQTLSNVVLTDKEPQPIDNLTPTNRSVFLTRPVPTRSEPIPEETDE